MHIIITFSKIPFPSALTYMRVVVVYSAQPYDHLFFLKCGIKCSLTPEWQGPLLNGKMQKNDGVPPMSAYFQMETMRKIQFRSSVEVVFFLLSIWNNERWPRVGVFLHPERPKIKVGCEGWNKVRMCDYIYERRDQRHNHVITDMIWHTTQGSEHRTKAASMNIRSLVC